MYGYGFPTTLNLSLQVFSQSLRTKFSSTIAQAISNDRTQSRSIRPHWSELDQALFHGSSLGGARPKAFIESGDRKFIAKFPSITDVYSVVKAEFVAMRLAKIAGLDVASVKLERAAHKEVLLVERFDRKKTSEGWTRKAMVSALTLLELDEMMARYASYDICPQNRSGNEASQAMLITQRQRMSRLDVCIEVVPFFLLSADSAKEIIAHQEKVIKNHWTRVCDEANLTETDRAYFWKRQFLNPYIFEDA